MSYHLEQMCLLSYHSKILNLKIIGTEKGGCLGLHLDLLVRDVSVPTPP